MSLNRKKLTNILIQSKNICQPADPCDDVSDRQQRKQNIKLYSAKEISKVIKKRSSIVSKALVTLALHRRFSWSRENLTYPFKPALFHCLCFGPTKHLQ